MALTITQHAVARYQERVRPTLGNYGQVRRELEALIGQAEHVPELDWWHRESPPGGFLLLSDGVALLLDSDRSHALTCVVRGDAPLADRRAERKAKRQRKRNRRYVVTDEKRGRQAHRKRERLRADG